ncbi:MAG: DUF2093 domain-containing protein [Pseudomonadota bacterium]
MMNRLEHPRGGGEASLRYLDGDYQVIRPGTFVRCAVTDTVIPIEELRYWSVVRQEAYASPEIAMERYLETDAARD